MFIKKFIKYFLLSVLLFIVLVFCFLFVGRAATPAHINWGVNFSERHAMNFGLDWKTAYEALLTDLNVKRIKVLADWDILEPARGEYNFDDVAFQAGEAEKHGAKLLVVLGMKTGRWPECHLPEWAKGLTKEEQQREILILLTAAVTRLKPLPAIEAWQVENEAMFFFGDCPWYDTEFLKTEVALVRGLDPSRPIVVTDSGEIPLWWKAAQIGDVVGTTLYRTVWFSQLNNYVTYPIPPIFYGRKAALEKFLFGKPVWNVELQAEPWGKTLLYDLPRGEQVKTMTPEKFADIIAYAKRTGLDTFYLWGGEWWYWLKEKHGDASMWNAAKEVFAGT